MASTTASSKNVTSQYPQTQGRPCPDTSSSAAVLGDGAGLGLALTVMQGLEFMAATYPNPGLHHILPLLETVKLVAS